jgi:hypothetical protein
MLLAIVFVPTQFGPCIHTQADLMLANDIEVLEEREVILLEPCRTS